MSRLIIGHTTDTEARIWVRGSQEHPTAFLSVYDNGDEVWSQTRTLEHRHFLTGVFEVNGLSPSREYRCEVRFARMEDTPPDQRQRFTDTEGRFRTFPPPDQSGDGLRFLLLSCNLHTLGLVSRPGPAFRRLTALAEDQGCDFALHCGDQIYADVPLPIPPTAEDYRRKYLDAWDDSGPTRHFLTRLPQYMILDDHEIRNNFHNQIDPPDANVEALMVSSLKVYREFQHIHNPQTFGTLPLYYTFSFGALHFFVLDVRTERHGKGPETQIVDEVQLDVFKHWLSDHRDDLKFVVSSVPFVGEILNDDDKWGAPPYLHQKHELLRFLIDERIERLVFLTGDMHNSYHARLRATDGSGNGVDVHELMSSPVNQLGKTSRGRYRPMGTDHQFTKPVVVNYKARFGTADDGEEAFYTGHSNAMLIGANARDDGRHDVHWEVYRTKRDRDPEISGSFAV